ncbi:hypothetical protein GQ54DRAFT_188301 [Martensiomyces pterosporus]|nr:hypothetical protein GQ54DRAFT_188301 [Martensiomyces pterosporus]
MGKKTSRQNRLVCMDGQSMRYSFCVQAASRDVGVFCSALPEFSPGAPRLLCLPSTGTPQEPLSPHTHPLVLSYSRRSRLAGQLIANHACPNTGPVTMPRHMGGSVRGATRDGRFASAGSGTVEYLTGYVQAPKPHLLDVSLSQSQLPPSSVFWAGPWKKAKQGRVNTSCCETADTGCKMTLSVYPSSRECATRLARWTCREGVNPC